MAVKDDDVRDDKRALYSPFIRHTYFQKDEIRGRKNKMRLMKNFLSAFVEQKFQL